MSIYGRYLRNDLRQNRAVTGALAAVLILSAFLMASGAMVMERLAGSVDRMFDVAKPPHFLQMHRGEYDPAALRDFADSRPEIAVWQVEETIGFGRHAITWERPATGERGDLSESMIDNLFVTQNSEFDLLLDAGDDDAVPAPADGEVYVPVAYQQQFGLQVGDQLSVATAADFVVAGFVRDAQMASSMASATRFVVSEGDFAALSDAGGDAENIVEFRLTDVSLLGEFQRAYESNPDLPRNGQAVTEVMIRLVNMLSDGLAAIALVFASLLLVAIALLNVRFVIRGTIEDEIREIGAMRAIGLTNRVISGLYLGRYGAMTVAACLVGASLAVPAVGALTRGMRANFAEAPVTALTVIAPVAALIVLVAVVLAVCVGVLRAVGRIDVVSALVHGSTTPEAGAAHPPRKRRGRGRPSALSGSHPGTISRRLALVDLRAELSQWLLVPTVFFLSAVLIVLPTTTLNTLEDPRFVTNMGAPASDLRADIQFMADSTVDAATAELLARMAADERIDAVSAFAWMLYETPGEDGWESLPIEVGNYTGSSLSFVSGRAPAEGEIALSVLNADKYGASVGDPFTIRRNGDETTLTVSGLYQDATSGGFTAKTHGHVTAGADRWVVFADVVDGVDPEVVASDLGGGGATVLAMREYVNQTLSYVTTALRTAAAMALAFGLGAAALIVTLFLRLHLAKERHAMGVLGVVGFSMREIASQVHLKTLIMVITGTLLGVAFAATAGEPVVGALLSAMRIGLVRLDFLPNPWIVYLAYPFALIAVGMAGAVALTRRLAGADRSQWLR